MFKTNNSNAKKISKMSASPAYTANQQGANPPQQGVAVQQVPLSFTHEIPVPNATGWYEIMINSFGHGIGCLGSIPLCCCCPK